jgi:hypothetical protein
MERKATAPVAEGRGFLSAPLAQRDGGMGGVACLLFWAFSSLNPFLSLCPGAFLLASFSHQGEDGLSSNSSDLLYAAGDVPEAEKAAIQRRGFRIQLC